MAAISSLLMAGGSLLSADAQAKGYQMQGKYTEAMNAINIRRAEVQKKDALKRGEEESRQYMQKVKGMAGSQKVALAAQGISVDGGSAADIMKETQVLGYEDSLRIKNNAFREALGFGMQQQEYAMDSARARADASSRSFSTLLSGGMQAAGHFAQWGKDSGKF
jgi:hypothetical protein